jgi:ubiquinone/menaquinone biosynthesis C-methylase UbiE
VVDYGCGNGFLTLDLARAVLPDGRVYAIDIQKEMIDDLILRIPEELKSVIHPILIRERELPLNDGEIDFFFMVNVLHEIKDKDYFLKEAAKTVKTSGKIVVVEWKKEKSQKGPPLDERISPEDLEKLLEKVKFRRLNLIEFKYHYLYLGVKVEP